MERTIKETGNITYQSELILDIYLEILCLGKCQGLIRPNNLLIPKGIRKLWAH